MSENTTNGNLSVEQRKYALKRLAPVGDNVAEHIAQMPKAEGKAVWDELKPAYIAVKDAIKRLNAIHGKHKLPFKSGFYTHDVRKQSENGKAPSKAVEYKESDVF